MKLIHLSDLHLGKRVNEISMLADQRYILAQILEIIDREAAQAVLIAGDVYDKSVPVTEAVTMFDGFLSELSRRGLAVFVISGNHDSPERLAFGASLMGRSGVYLSPVYDGTVTPVRLEDRYGPVLIYMLPFVKPAHVRRFYEDEGVETYTDALRTAVSHMPLEPEHRSVLITHQFVTGAARSDSEEITVGGTDNVDASVFAPFDYVALGHIHRPQSVGRETIRYCGTPLKYSFSEKDDQKSVTVVELAEKGNITLRTVPLTPLRDMREVRGTFAELTGDRRPAAGSQEDYLRIVLTDEEDVPDGMRLLRLVYPNLMKLDYDNTRTRHTPRPGGPEHLVRKTELELLAEFYERENGQPMSQEQARFAGALLEEIREETL